MLMTVGLNVNWDWKQRVHIVIYFNIGSHNLTNWISDQIYETLNDYGKAMLGGPCYFILSLIDRE